MSVFDPLVNKTFAEFEIRERIKSGGMAIVYQAYDTRRNIIVALKVLQENLALHDDIVQRFVQEARIAQRLRHTNIVQFFDTGQHDGRLYIVMQYMAGGSFVDYLSANPIISLERTKQILQQIGSALDYAHRESVVHRDLKLGNILLDDQGNALLTDFGIARLLDATQALTMPDQQMPGTVKYMSPEQVRGHTDLDYRSDLYSFAVIGYLLATGRYPFTGTNDFVILNQHLNMQPPAPTSVNPFLPPAIDDVIWRGLAKNPENRYASAGEFVQAFKNAIIGYEDLEVNVNMRAENPALPPEPTSIDTSIPGVSSVLGQTTRGAPIETPSQMVMASQTQRPVPWWVVVITVGFVLILGGFAFIRTTDRNNQETAYTTSTAAALAALQNATETPTFTETPTITPSPTPTFTDTPTITPSPTPTFTDTPTITPSPTPTFTDTPTINPSQTPTTAETSNANLAATQATSTPQHTPTPSLSPTPLFTTPAELVEAFNRMGTQNNFDCQSFVAIYEFLQLQSMQQNPIYAALWVLIDNENDPMVEIYTQFCADDRDNPDAFISFELYSEMFEALKPFE